MQLFKRKTAMAKTEAEISALRTRAETLKNRHAAADAALLDAKSNLQRHHFEADLDADDKTRVKLEAQIAACVVTRDGYADALADLQAKITDAERRLADERSATARKAASEALSRAVDAVEHVLPAYLEASRKLSDALGEIHHHHESVQMRLFIDNTTAQVETAVAFVTRELLSIASAIAQGSMPIPAPKPEPQPVVMVEQKPPTRTLFCMKSLRWQEDGRLRTALQWTDVELPEHLAERALRTGACVPLTSEHRKKLLGARGGQHPPSPDTPDLTDLDDISEFSGAKFVNPNDPVFTVIERGPARKIAVAGPSIL
jgi:hypothetical protein